MLERGCVTDVPGISAGHYTDTSAPVGTSRAITSGVQSAVGLQGLPAVSDLTEAQHG